MSTTAANLEKRIEYTKNIKPVAGWHYNPGWWYTNPSEKYEFVSWDDDYSQYMESHKINVPNHQPNNMINIDNIDEYQVLVVINH